MTPLDATYWYAGRSYSSEHVVIVCIRDRTYPSSFGTTTETVATFVRDDGSFGEATLDKFKVAGPAEWRVEVTA